jgi:hypothetical protein
MIEEMYRNGHWRRMSAAGRRRRGVVGCGEITTHRQKTRRTGAVDSPLATCSFQTPLRGQVRRVVARIQAGQPIL